MLKADELIHIKSGGAMKFLQFEKYLWLFYVVIRTLPILLAGRLPDPRFTRYRGVCCFVLWGVCVALFFKLWNWYWGIVTVPGSFLKSGDLGWPDPHPAPSAPVAAQSSSAKWGTSRVIPAKSSPNPKVESACAQCNTLSTKCVALCKRTLSTNICPLIQVETL